MLGLAQRFPAAVPHEQQPASVALFFPALYVNDPYLLLVFSLAVCTVS